MKKEKKIQKNIGKKEEIKEKKEAGFSGYWLLIVLVGIFVVFLATVFVINESKSFDLYGHEWVKMKMGDLLFYHTKAHVTQATGQEVNYNLYLLNDPREMNLFNGEIQFRKNVTFVSISPDLNECKYANKAIVDLGQFLSGMGLPAKGAINIKNYSENNYALVPYVDCGNRPGNTVILIRKADSSTISKVGECYVIEVGNCEILKQTETFIVSALKAMTI